MLEFCARWFTESSSGRVCVFCVLFESSVFYSIQKKNRDNNKIVFIIYWLCKNQNIVSKYASLTIAMEVIHIDSVYFDGLEVKFIACEKDMTV